MFYIPYQIDILTHGTAFGEPVSSACPCTIHLGSKEKTNFDKTVQPIKDSHLVHSLKLDDSLSRLLTHSLTHSLTQALTQSVTH